MKNNRACTSEFEKGMYDVPLIVDLLESISDSDKADCENARLTFEKALNSFRFSYHRRDRNKILFSLFTLPEVPEDSALTQLKKLESSEVSSYIDVGKRVSDFIGAAKQLRFSSDEHAVTLFDKEAAKNYLNMFFSLSKDVVFSVNNINLYYSEFRKSEFLRELMEFGAIKKPDEKQNHYQFSFLNPFSYYTVARVLSNLERFENDERIEKKQFTAHGRTPLLYEFRKSIFMDAVTSAFKRYFYIDGKTYRANLSRHYLGFSAFPSEALSSTEEIKPIRLFEKTAAYIRTEIEKCLNGILEVRVAIIGHVEPSLCGEPLGLIDYGASVVNWYSKLMLEEKPDLNLVIISYTSVNDWPPSALRDDWKYEKEALYGTCKISYSVKLKPVDFQEAFGFNTELLNQLIVENHILFILDCPWLSTENYELAQDITLESFCRQLEERDIVQEIDRNDKFLDNIHSIYSGTTFSRLNAQYNRIMASATMRSGTIVRIIRDPLLRRIESLFRKATDSDPSNKRKLLYIFSSEQEGIHYSWIAAYVQTRQEKYDGRTHWIAQFDSLAAQQLPFKERNKLTFSINFWSILKYISISYGYRGLEDHIREILHQDICEDRAISFLELYRSIRVCFEVSKDFKQIQIWVVLRPGIDSCIMDLSPHLSNSELPSIKEKIHHLACELIEPLYCNSVFGENRHFGDDAIKIAFKMNLYGCIEDVSLMLFWHRYSTLAKKKALESYFRATFLREKIKAPDWMPDEWDEFKDKDYFMDRKLYEYALATLEQGNDFTFALQGMFSDSDRRMNWIGSRERVLRNIISACETAGEENTLLYKTALKMQREG